MRLLLVHGWANNRRAWRLQAPLRREFNVEAIDLPGHGAGEGWDRPDLTPGLRRIEAILADGEPTIGIGWSLGGQLFLSLGRRIPASLKGIVTVGSTPSFIRKPGFRGGISPARGRTMRNEAVKDFQGALKKFRPVNFSGPEKKDPALPGWMALLEDSTAGLVEEDVLRCLDGIIQADSRSGITGIRIPVLVVHGTSDAVCPFGAADFLTAALTRGRLRGFQDAGHVPFITHAESFNRLVRDFAIEAGER